MARAKFKVGNELRCISEGQRGAGWKKGHVFVVRDITDGIRDPVYWPVPKGSGIFESSVELVVHDWDE